MRGLLITHAFTLSAGSQERNPEALFEACLKILPIRSFWDVGANIGLYSWLIKTRLPHARVLMFEPLPINTALVKDTLRRTHLTDVELIEAAVSDRQSRSTLHTDNISGATSSLEDQIGVTFVERHWGLAAGHLDVRTVTVDDERKARGPVDLIKIDVEGHERNVLQGAAGTIGKDWPLLFVECMHSDAQCLKWELPSSYRIVNALPGLSRRVVSGVA